MNDHTTPVGFSKPPVVEVVFGVLFASQNLLKTAHVGAFWDQVKEIFPVVDDAAPVATMIDEPGTQVIEWLDLPPLRRTWLMSDDGRKILQIQQDRLLFNWKRALSDDIYPSYDTNVAEFEENLLRFEKFLVSMGIVLPGYRQFELTYVNHITDANGLDKVDINDVLVDHIRSSKESRFLPEPEGFNWATSYLLPENNGRLHISAQVEKNLSASKRAVRLDLNARGIPVDSSPHGRRVWFNLAHHWITHSFADITSRELQDNVWMRTS